MKIAVSSYDMLLAYQGALIFLGIFRACILLTRC